MANEHCEDCLFMGESYRWQEGNYCNKRQCRVDPEGSACSSFLESSHDCCYDCENGRDRGITFWCSAHKKTIANPHAFYCYSFRY